MKKLLIISAPRSCVSINSSIRSNRIKMNYDEDLSFDELNQLLSQYAKKNSYPNLNQ